MERKNRIPNTRLSLFYDEIDFDMDVEMARDVVEKDMNFAIVLYRVDRIHSNSDDVYGESDAREIRFLPPVELIVRLTIEKGENKTYSDNGNLRYQEYGNLKFTVMTAQLEERGVDISFGDFVGYSDKESNLKYFEVFDDGKINADNKHTLYGYKPYFRSVGCVVVDPDKFNGV